jgi:nitroreductase
VIDNAILTALRERRSAHRFTDDPVPPEHIDAILEAGRWAPSAANAQPWDFVVVTDPALRGRMGAILREITWAWAGFAAAPAMIVVAVDPGRDPRHFVEAGAVAAQNLCLAAHGLGLASSWAGVYDHAGKGTAEKDIVRLLALPRTHRVIAVVPVGAPGIASHGSRRPLLDMVHRDRFAPATSPAAATADELEMAPATAGSGAAG